ncbi:Protein CBR-SRO-1 [Caenorhabditis briggsae]|uniref:Protein CBR-SRO-1 n=1 Tax=Caenorhabditis briggsae TaxID=6238 RepID=A8XGZ2_CAEBR|nr:Protein CBR-SRO-1 [Caenorhabditis briggsae]CAP31916.2 Protein CBR-SRO-1 [Caenorhabditis briggsae]
MSAAVPLILNLVSLVPIFYRRQQKGKAVRDNASLQPLVWLLVVDVLMSAQLIVPIHNFLMEKGTFSEWSCVFYGAADMTLSLVEVLLACMIAFDRYIVTITPKWGKWRCHSNYFKIIFFAAIIVGFWSFVPTAGYGKYTIPTLCPRYIAFLTATCLVFFLIPVCIASSLYYSIIDHVDSQNSSEVQLENGVPKPEVCTWAPRNHVAKVGLGCLLVSVLPFFAYSVVCLNPMKSDFHQIHYIVVPVIISRVSTLLNPIFYVWLNPEIIPINEFIAKRAKPRPQRPLYHTINLIADVPGMSFPILTPTIPRRQLPKIPPHLASPSKPSLNDFLDEDSDSEPKEHTPML